MKKKEIHLRGGTEVQFPAGTKKLNGDIAKAGEKHRIARGMLVVDMENGTRNLRCGVTHLDHMSMKERQVQLKHIVEELIPKDIESEKNTDIIQSHQNILNDKISGFVEQMDDVVDGLVKYVQDFSEFYVGKFNINKNVNEIRPRNDEDFEKTLR